MAAAPAGPGHGHGHGLNEIYDKLLDIESRVSRLEARLCAYAETARTRREAISTAAAAAGAGIAAITILLHYTG